MRILLLSRYGRRGASSRIRFYQYLPYLRERGWEVDVLPLLGNEYLEELYSRGRKSLSRLVIGSLARIGRLLSVRDYDLVWVEGEILPWVPAWVETALERLGIPYVVDYDDAIFHRYDQHARPLVRAFLGSKIDQVMRRAALVLAGNQYLMDRARGVGVKRVEYLPSVVDLRDYPVAVRPEAASTFTIGWIGSPVTAGYLERVAPALQRVTRDARARLLLVGAGAPVAGGIPTDVRAWSEERQVQDIGDFDVGIMPLTDSLWERGKCGFKLIQYMARGLPVVASPVGVNSHLVRDGVNGFLASTVDEWTQALTSLQGDSELRARMGRAGRARVEQEFSLHVTAPRLLALLAEVRRSRAQ